MIKYIIEKGVNLGCTTNHEWKPIHFICHYSTIEMMEYIMNYKINDIYSYVSHYNGKIVHYNCMDLINERFADSSNELNKNKFIELLSKYNKL